MPRTDPRYNLKRWQDLRRQVRERDGNACVICGATEGLSVDHIVAITDDPSDANFFDPHGCRTLCAAHHRRKTVGDMTRRGQIKGRGTVKRRPMPVPVTAPSNGNGRARGRGRGREASRSPLEQPQTIGQGWHCRCGPNHARGEHKLGELCPKVGWRSPLFYDDENELLR
jgi:hypothetical protein